MIRMLSESEGAIFSTSGITSAAELEKEITANNFQLEKCAMWSIANPTIIAKAKLQRRIQKAFLKEFFVKVR